MTSISTITLDVEDPAQAEAFYATAFGLGPRLAVRAGAEPTTGFRGFVLSLVVSQPGNVDALFSAAVAGGAVPLKSPHRGFWGYGGVLQAPDGAIWKIATSAKKDTAAPTRQVDDVVLLIGVADVAASKRFYTEHGLTVARSYGRKYVDFESPAQQVKLALYGRRAAAKDAGVPVDGTGSHRILIGGGADTFTDPDGFAWAPAPVAAATHPAAPRR